MSREVLIYDKTYRTSFIWRKLMYRNVVIIEVLSDFFNGYIKRLILITYVHILKL